MSLLNNFLNKSRETGRLDVTPMRLGGPTPVVDLFVVKLGALVRRVAPSVKVRATKPVDLRAVVPAGTLRDNESGLVNWAQAVSRSPAVASRKQVDSQSLVSEMLDQYASLHSAAYAVYTDAMCLAPGRGLGIAGGLSVGMASNGQLVTLKTTQTGFARAIDSMYLNAFAEAHAITEFARAYGSKLALELIDAVERDRASAGEFSLYSTSSQSFDSKGALDILRMELEGGAIFGRLGREDLVTHALDIASEATGTWLIKHGAKPSAAESIVERISMTSKGLYTPRPELDQSQENKVDQKARTPRPQRA